MFFPSEFIRIFCKSWMSNEQRDNIHTRHCSVSVYEEVKFTVWSCSWWSAGKFWLIFLACGIPASPRGFLQPLRTSSVRAAALLLPEDAHRGLMHSPSLQRIILDVTLHSNWHDLKQTEIPDSILLSSFPATPQQLPETKTNHSSPCIYILLRALRAFSPRQEMHFTIFKPLCDVDQVQVTQLWKV